MSAESSAAVELTPAHRRTVRSISATLLVLSLCACGLEGFAPAPPGARMIPVRGVLAQYLLIESEHITYHRLHAMVLQQFSDGVPGVRLAYQVDCRRAAAFTNNSQAETLRDLRRDSLGDEFFRTRDPTEADQQVATWLCQQPIAPDRFAEGLAHAG